MGVKATPIGERVLIEPAAAEEKTAAGIIIPDTAKEKPKRGSVIETGSGQHEFTVKKGDTVLYGQYSGTEVKIEGKEYLIMKEDEILLIVK
jgi:chaperonin GroES